MSTSDRPFDLSRASIKGPDFFPRLRVSGPGVPLHQARLSPGTLLLLFDRAGERHALLRHQMAFHHLAQGEVRGEPYLVAF